MHFAQSACEVVLGRLPSSQLFLKFANGCLICHFQDHHLATHLPHRDLHHVQNLEIRLFSQITQLELFDSSHFKAMFEPTLLLGG